MGKKNATKIKSSYKHIQLQWTECADKGITVNITDLKIIMHPIQYLKKKPFSIYKFLVTLINVYPLSSVNTVHLT